MITVQNSVSVTDVLPLDASIVERQLEAVIEDIPPDAAKVGALGSAAIVDEVGAWVERMAIPVVVDPVMISTHGQVLMPESATQAFLDYLLPFAFLITPNLHEASVLAGIEVDSLATMEEAAKAHRRPRMPQCFGERWSPDRRARRSFVD